MSMLPEMHHVRRRRSRYRSDVLPEACGPDRALHERRVAAEWEANGARVSDWGACAVRMHLDGATLEEIRVVVHRCPERIRQVILRAAIHTARGMGLTKGPFFRRLRSEDLADLRTPW